MVMNILMYGHDGSLNRGCEAIVRSSSEMLKDRIIDCQITLASGNPSTDEILDKLDYIFDSSPLDFRPNFFEKVRVASEVRLLKSEHYALGKIHKSVINKIKDIDILLSIGGDNYCYGEQPGFYGDIEDSRVEAYTFLLLPAG